MGHRQNGWFPRWWMTSLILLVCSLLTAPATAARLLILGDSLSAAHGIPQSRSWVLEVTKRSEKRLPPMEIINASISGETTSGGLARLPALLDTHQPDMVLIELGANDGLRGFPPAVTERNLDQMITQILRAGSRPILMQIRLPATYGRRYLDRFEAVYPKLATRHRIPLVPFLLEPLADSPDLFQPDGLHPLATAQPLIADFVWEHLEPLLPGRTPEP